VYSLRSAAHGVLLLKINAPKLNRINFLKSTYLRTFLHANFFIGKLHKAKVMDRTTPSDPANILTTRQFNVFVLWIKEFSIAQIGDKLHLSYWCVDKELRIIYKLLGARTAKYAVDKAWLLGIFTIENRK